LSIQMGTCLIHVLCYVGMKSTIVFYTSLPRHIYIYQFIQSSPFSVVGTLYRSRSSNVTIHHNTALHTLPLHPNSPDRNLIRRRRTSWAPT